MSEEFFRRYPRSQRSEKYRSHISRNGTLKGGLKRKVRRRRRR